MKFYNRLANFVVSCWSCYRHTNRQVDAWITSKTDYDCQSAYPGLELNGHISKSNCIIWRNLSHGCVMKPMWTHITNRISNVRIIKQVLMIIKHPLLLDYFPFFYTCQCIAIITNNESWQTLTCLRCDRGFLLLRPIIHILQRHNDPNQKSIQKK